MHRPRDRIEPRPRSARVRGRPPGRVAALALDDRGGLQSAVMGSIAALDLDRRVLDPEPIVELATHGTEHRVVVETGRANEVRGERDLGGAHGPDVEVVNALDAADPGEIL